MTFWDRFYSLCKISGTSPNPVCKELGLSNATATKWKNGSVPKSDTVKLIADYFGVSTDYLLTGGNTDGGIMHKVDRTVIDVSMAAISDIRESETDDELKNKIESIIGALTADKQKEVLSYAEYVRDKK